MRLCPPLPQASLSVRILEEVQALPSSGNVDDPLEDFVAKHGGKEAVLADPELLQQLLPLLGVESAVLLQAMNLVGRDVKAVLGLVELQCRQMEEQRRQLNRIESAVRARPAAPVLLSEAHVYSFIPGGMMPQIRNFWINSFGDSKEVPWSRFVTCLRARLQQLLDDLEAQLLADSPQAAQLKPTCWPDGVFLGILLRELLDPGSQGTVQVSHCRVSRYAATCIASKSSLHDIRRQYAI